jgi:citrate synthase
MTVEFKPGLEGVTAARTRLSAVDGEAGTLTVCGFPIEVLARNASFEEVIWLLWHHALPTATELAELRSALWRMSALTPDVTTVLRLAAGRRTSPLEAIRMGIDALALSRREPPTALEDALLLVAASPAITGAYWRLLNGRERVAPRADLGYAANYLYMLTGETPSEAESRALDTYLCTVADHGMNASTFTARVIISTQSDLISAVVGAIGALKGPLHGGAPGPALDVVFDVQREGNAEAYLRRKIEAGERFMGFGHRV